MRSACTFVLAVSALAANLLLPQKLISYAECCYDSNGHLTACCLNYQAQKASIRNVCCEPVERQLRTGAAPEIIESAKAQLAAGAIVVLPPVHTTVLGLSETNVHRLADCTGPPQTVELIHRYSRLNI
ncbi:MAG TPA: hypothetical protein VEK08_21030 [Planctomycetota bacterium]|nr:hypothetical protein [Planctomycetota bacterium]